MLHSGSALDIRISDILKISLSYVMFYSIHECQKYTKNCNAGCDQN